MSTSCIGPVSLPVNHQGIILFTTGDAESFTITVSPDKVFPQDVVEEQYFCLSVDTNEAQLKVKLQGSSEPILLFSAHGDKVAVDQNVLVTYWLSFLTNYDQETKETVPELRYGKGFSMDKTTLMKTKCAVANCDALFTYKTEKFVKVTQKSSSLESTSEHHLFMNKVPVTIDPSPVVLNASNSTLLDIDEEKTTLSSMLPTKARMLFDTVKDLELDPILAKAINYSLTTQGKTLYNKVQEKNKSGFGKGEAYIRVTLGKDTKIGVGIPFVLEIWPAGIKSPIHNHGNASAVIKVLHGEIHIDNYNKLTLPERYPNEDERIHYFDCKKGDLTWMDKNYYQVHQLINKTKEYCATIQCYLYGEGDRVYYPAFDFVQYNSTNVKPFYPDSDYDYKVLRNIVLKEYYDSKKSWKNRFFGVTPKRSSRVGAQSSEPNSPNRLT